MALHSCFQPASLNSPPPPLSFSLSLSHTHQNKNVISLYFTTREDIFVETIVRPLSLSIRVVFIGEYSFLVYFSFCCEVSCSSMSLFPRPWHKTVATEDGTGCGIQIQICIWSLTKHRPVRTAHTRLCRLPISTSTLTDTENTYVGGWGWGVEGSRLEAWMKSHKSEVAIT